MKKAADVRKTFEDKFNSNVMEALDAVEDAIMEMAEDGYKCVTMAINITFLEPVVDVLEKNGYTVVNKGDAPEDLDFNLIQIRWL